MSKKWNVTVDGEGYEVQYINNKKIMVNGKELLLKDYPRNMTMTTTEYEIPIGSQKAQLIVKSLNSAWLVVNGVNCESGEEAVSEKTQLPKWAYIFVVLHCVNFINGLPGCAMAILGIGSIKLISDSKKLNEKLEILVDLAILLILYVVSFGKYFLR